MVEHRRLENDLLNCTLGVWNRAVAEGFELRRHGSLEWEGDLASLKNSRSGFGFMNLASSATEPRMADHY